jgi:hypothetical protein
MHRELTRHRYSSDYRSRWFGRSCAQGATSTARFGRPQSRRQSWVLSGPASHISLFSARPAALARPPRMSPTAPSTSKAALKGAPAASKKKKGPGSTVGAPAQRAQSSRKGKRAWRKNVDLDEVEEALEGLRAEERITGYVRADVHPVFRDGGRAIQVQAPRADERAAICGRHDGRRARCEDLPLSPSPVSSKHTSQSAGARQSSRPAH